METNRAASVETTLKKHDESSDAFIGIGCFKCTSSSQVKDYAKLHQAPPRCIAFALQKPIKIELEIL